MAICAHCGYELDATEATCPLCGTPADSTGGRASSEELDLPLIPWEDPGVPFPGNVWRTWASLMAAPGTAFRRVPFDRPVARAVLFYLIVVITAAFFSLIGSAILGVPEGLQEMLGGYDLGVEISGGALVLMSFFATPFLMLFGLFINSLIVHLFVAMLARERRTLGATVRVLSYSVAPYPIMAIPIVGPFVSGVWILLLTIVGVRDAHRTTTGRATAVVLLPIAILFTLWVLLLALAVALSVAEQPL